MILVLVGEQGIKKTEFFRNLLPKELNKYYSESNLDEGKDSEILMCKKLLIVDDEFGGKSKKDATKLKRLSSQQTFSIRAPYGRITEDLNRLAVLGGTSNDSEVINDPTGNRRIIPVNLISFDIDKFKSIDKTKLFIELYNEWKSNPTGWFLTKDEIYFLNETTTKNTEVSQEDEIVMKYIKSDLYNSMTTTDIKIELEKKLIGLKTSTKRIGQALKKLGFKQEILKVEGKTMRIYRVISVF
jgi:predicted P-loop ATPase